MTESHLLIRRLSRSDAIRQVKFLLLGALLILVRPVMARWISVTTPGAHGGNTWSIVAVDPETGDVGIAAASCVPVSIDAVAALVPGRGAAATQAAFSLPNRNQVFARLQEGLTADAVIEAVTDPAFDAQAASRQYGVVTLDQGQVRAAGFTGEDNGAWAGDVQDLEAAVSVQGNILEAEAVVVDALAAFRDETNGSTALPDRLMRALEAGSAAGGDRRCNRDGVQQTAQSAFIMVARADQQPFAVVQMGQSQPDQADAPWLYLSVTEPFLGDNPIVALRQQYDLWWTEQLPPPAPSLSPETTLLLGIVSLALLAGVIWLATRKPKRPD